MTLTISPEAVRFIAGKGGVCAVRQPAVKACCGGMPLPEVTYRAPKDPASYAVLESNGITVHLGRTLRFRDDVVAIELGGAFFFRDLDFPTLRHLD